MLEYKLFVMCEVFNLTEMSMHEFMKSCFSVGSLRITFSNTFSSSFLVILEVF